MASRYELGKWICVDGIVQGGKRERENQGTDGWAFKKWKEKEDSIMEGESKVWVEIKEGSVSGEGKWQQGKM